MKVVIDDGSGFCFGVVNAIAKAERLLADGERVVSLGDIVHNRVEVQRLERLGLKSIGLDEFRAMRSGTALIRAHGEPPSTYAQAESCGVRIVDATCPVVADLQRRVREAGEKMDAVGGQVVILGRRGHAEVVGLTGQVGERAIVIEGVEDLAAVDFGRPVYLLSQTTQSLALFGRVKDEILARAADPAQVTIDDTICRRVANREPRLREFAASVDVVVFVSGRKSSNGKVLFEVCREVNPRSHMIEDETELQAAWFAGAQSAGVCGATSTPKWLMAQVAAEIEENF